MIKPEEFLPLVQRPSRYMDHEFNAVPAKPDAAVKVALCFPDMYEIGASNLGLEILYHTVNRVPDFSAERCYCPAADLEALMRARGIPLHSLESSTPLKQFDIVGFTLQFELCATNIVNMLDLSGIPLLAKDRGVDQPLIIGGGPVTANPEPLADLFDAFVLGDGECAIMEIIAQVRRPESGDRRERRELLKQLAKIPGVYVPSLYDVSYNADGTIAAFAPNAPEAETVIKKRVEKLDDLFFPAKQIVPFAETVHNRLNIEIARGCPGQCRFCQAQKYYFPWRMRTLEHVQKLVSEGLEATGYAEVSFSSLSCTQYKYLEPLLSSVKEKFGRKKISVSLPSLRCDQFSLKVASTLTEGKRNNLTFAPEAGTDRLRNIIGKDLTGTEIRATLVLAYQSGWRQIKLYFMVGLPFETDPDITGIRDLVVSLRKAAPLNFGVTLSPFVPKAQTAFQWAPMAKPDYLLEVLQKLGKSMPASIKSYHVEASVLEGVFARGDRRLGTAIIKAWELGCRFDQWKEHLRNDLWQQAFAATGIDTAFYLYRERGENEILPWQHLQFGQEKALLWADLQAAKALAEAPQESVAKPVVVSIPALPVPGISPSPKPIQKLRMRFARQGLVRFISHLEQIELFRRAVRRCDLPIAFTSGFHAQPKMAFGPAISVGYESESEYAEVDLVSHVDPAQVQARMSAALPNGFTILSVRKVPVFFPSVDALANVAEYRIGLELDKQAIEKFLAAPEIIIIKEKKGKTERIDVKPLIITLESGAGQTKLVLRFGPKKNVKPERIIALIANLSDDQAKMLPITRLRLLVEKRDNTLTEP